MSIEEVEKQIRESAPLSDRLTDCKDRIGKMCAEGRPPKMSIPAQWNDDDLFICTTLSDAQAVEREKDEELAWMMNRNIDLERMWNASERYAKYCVTTIKETEAALAAAQGEVERLKMEFEATRKELGDKTWRLRRPYYEAWLSDSLKKDNCRNCKHSRPPTIAHNPDRVSCQYADGWPHWTNKCDRWEAQEAFGGKP